nr:hypothetical protein GCM10020093_014260 [Planobispora longispora]
MGRHARRGDRRPGRGPPGTYESLAKLSTRGRYVLADTDEHYVHLARQDLVVGAVMDVVAAARP